MRPRVARPHVPRVAPNSPSIAKNFQASMGPIRRQTADRLPQNPGLKDPMQRPAPRRERVDAPRDGRVFFQRRGVVRLDPRVDHQRAGSAPVLVARRTAPAPCTSAAGLLRVNVDPQQVVQRAGREVAVVHQHDQRQVDRSGSVCWPSASQNVSTSRVRSAKRRPSTARTPGRQMRGRRNPSGKRSSPSSVGKRAPRRADGGDHQLRAFVQAAARVVERVDRGAGLKVQVASPVDALQQMPQETRRCRECRAPGQSSRATISRYLASDNCPCPSTALARSAILAAGGARRRACSARCRSPAAADARRPHRRHARRASPAITVGMAGPVIS